MKIKLQFLNKNFNNKTILSIRNYEFESGKIYGIIGPNGGGKTTLLRIIGGLDKNFFGEILYDDFEYNKDFEKMITYLSQNPYMLNRTVYENIAYPLKIRKCSKEEIKNKVNKMLDRLNIQELSEKKAVKLSAGEKQKVSLARGLVFNPKLILLDEPTANIDPNTVELIENILIDYQRLTKATILIVTHNLSQALRACNNIVILKNNDLLETTKEEIFDEFRMLNNIDSFLEMNYKILGV